MKGTCRGSGRIKEAEKVSGAEFQGYHPSLRHSRENGLIGPPPS